MPALLQGIRRLNLSVLFVIGGDGSHQLAASIAAAAADDGIRLRLALARIIHQRFCLLILRSVACVPKTIDNDLPVIDRSFGFETAVSEAVKAVRCAKVPPPLILQPLLPTIHRACRSKPAAPPMASASSD